MDTLNETQVALVLDVSIRTLARWRAAGNGPAFVKVGNRIGYPRESLVEYVASRAKIPEAA